MLGRVKIALISEHASPLASSGGTDSGGQNVYVAHVARELARQGHLVDVFTRRESFAQPASAAFGRGVRVFNVMAGPPEVMPKERLLPHMGEFAANIRTIFKAESRAGNPYTLTHANFFMSAMAGLELKNAFGVPLVITFHALGKVRRLHQGSDDGFPLERFAIEEHLIKRADRVIAECPQDRDDIVNLYGGDPQSLAIVPCGFDSKQFHPLQREAARERLRWPQDDVIILQLGRLVPRKGIDNVIRAMARLRSQYGDRARLYVVGGNSETPDEAATPEIARLRAIARAENVADCIEFTGRRGREELRYLYAASDVFVTTPWYEPFGITPLEAMACSRPVIGADVGGIRSTVVHDRTGLLVPPKDPDALASRLHELIADPRRRLAMGDAGYKRAHRHYTWTSVVRSLETVYFGVLQEHDRAPAKTVARRSVGTVRDALARPQLRAVRGGPSLVNGIGSRKLG